MSIKRYTNGGAWTEISSLKRYENGAYKVANSAKAYKNGAWQEVWSSGPKGRLEIVTPRTVRGNATEYISGSSGSFYLSHNSYGNIYENQPVKSIDRLEFNVIIDGTFTDPRLTFDINDNFGFYELTNTSNNYSYYYSFSPGTIKSYCNTYEWVNMSGSYFGATVSGNYNSGYNFNYKTIPVGVSYIGTVSQIKFNIVSSSMSLSSTCSDLMIFIGVQNVRINDVLVNFSDIMYYSNYLP